MKENLKTKSKIERDQETVKPTVINDTLIRQYIIQFNIENKIFDHDDMYVWDLTHLQLSYKNIVEIDNLKGMEKLVKLQLDNNIITKISNLNELVHLEWLDLSFNLIEKIEGLDKLTKLTDLSLYSNQISVLSGLENLANLNVLSVGKNKLTSIDESVRYLHGLNNNLEVLRINENDFKKLSDKDYKLYIIAYLKNIKYLDYELITEQERMDAREEHKDELSTDNDAANEQKEDQQQSVDPILVAAKIDCTIDIFTKIVK